jgi:hypothetical protein
MQTQNNHKLKEDYINALVNWWKNPHQYESTLKMRRNQLVMAKIQPPKIVLRYH